MKYIVTFHTHFDALQYKRFLDANRISGKLKPVPRTLSSSCGTCVEFDTSELVDKKSRFSEYDFENFYLIEGKEYRIIAEGDN